MPGNFDHNIDQSGRTFLTRFSHEPQGAKPKAEGTLLRTGVATFVIPGYATHGDGVCRRGVPCNGKSLLRKLALYKRNNKVREGSLKINR